MARGGQLVPGSAGWSCPWVRGHADRVLETGVWARTWWTLNLLTPVFTPVPTRKEGAPEMPACPQLPSLCWLLEVTLVWRPAARAPGAAAYSKHRQLHTHTHAPGLLAEALEGRAAVLAVKSRPVLCCPAGSLRPLEVMKTAKVTVVPRGLIRDMPDQIIGNLRVGWPQRTFLISEPQSPRPLLLELEGYLSSLQTDQPLGLYFR